MAPGNFYCIAHTNNETVLKVIVLGLRRCRLYPRPWPWTVDVMMI